MINMVASSEAKIAPEPRFKGRTAEQLEKFATTMMIVQTILNTTGAICVSIPCSLNTSIHNVQLFGGFCQFIGYMAGSIFAGISIIEYTKLQNLKKQSQMVVLGVSEVETKLRPRDTHLAKWHYVTQGGNLIVTGSTLGILFAMSCLDTRDYNNFWAIGLGAIVLMIAPVAVALSITLILTKKC